jgi:predicted DNA-binding transcriptional regulator AlpA
MDYFDVSRTTLHRVVKAGRFPAPFQISAGRIAWDNSKLWRFIEAGGNWTEPQEDRAAA